MHKKRLSKLQAVLNEIPCDGLLVEDEINLFYLTGLSLSAGQLLITTQTAHLIVDSRYYEMAKKRAPYPVILQEGPETFLKMLTSHKLPAIKTLAFSSDNTTYGSYLRLQERIDHFWQKSGRSIALKPVENPVAKLRIRKDEDELKILREAAKLGSEGFDYVLTLLKPGITEAEIAVELEIFWKRRGSKTLAFDPIIAFGTNSSMPHYRVGNQPLKMGQPVLIDIGVNFRHYHSDMTRVVFFGGADPKMLAIYEIVKSAQTKALELCRPGVPIGSLDSAAREIIAEAGYGENFTHSLGHGVGLEIHEAPTIRDKPPYGDVPLQEGMVITIEPGIYLPGIGGVRLEDTVAITREGHENLTMRPKDPLILEIY